MATAAATPLPEDNAIILHKMQWANPSASSSIQFILRWPNRITLWISETEASTIFIQSLLYIYDTDLLRFIDLSQRARVRLANVEADITQCPFREKMSVFGREGKCVVWCFVVASWQLSRASYWPWPAVINRPWLVSWITHTRHGLFGSLLSPRAFQMFSR